MKTRFLTAILGFILLLGSAAVAGWALTPRLVEVSPAPGADQVTARAPLRLTFSRPLDYESAKAHLVIDPPLPGQVAWQGNTLVFTPNHAWPSGATVQVEFVSGARAAGFPVLPLQKGLTWAFRVDQVRLAYLWPSDGPADLYALDPLSGDVRRLTENAGILDYSLNTEGNVVFFCTNDGRSGSRIWRVDLSQGMPLADKTIQPTLLLECPQALCRLARASPDGAWLAYERLSFETSAEPLQSAVWLLSLKTNHTQPAEEAGHITSYPVWSGNGWLAFYDQQAQGYVLLQPENGSRLTLPNQTGEAGAWQPDGRAFVAAEVFFETSKLLEPNATSHLVRYELDLADSAVTAQLDLTQAFNLEDRSPVFSPDGARVVFARRYLAPARWTPGRQAWVMNADGSQAQALSQVAAFNHYGFAWSPDGSQIAYVRSDPTLLTQPPELWVMNADGSDPIQLVIGGYAPAWIP